MNTRTTILAAVGVLALTACSNADDTARTDVTTGARMETSATAPASDGAMAPTDGTPNSTPRPDATGTTTEPTGDDTAPGQTPPVLPTDPQDRRSPPPQ